MVRRKWEYLNIFAKAKYDFIPKTGQKSDLTWVEIVQVHSKSNRPTLKPKCWMQQSE